MVEREVMETICGGTIFLKNMCRNLNVGTGRDLSQHLNPIWKICDPSLHFMIGTKFWIVIRSCKNNNKNQSE